MGLHRTLFRHSLSLPNIGQSMSFVSYSVAPESVVDWSWTLVIGFTLPRCDSQTLFGGCTSFIIFCLSRSLLRRRSSNMDRGTTIRSHRETAFNQGPSSLHDQIVLPAKHSPTASILRTSCDRVFGAVSTNPDNLDCVGSRLPLTKLMLICRHWCDISLSAQALWSDIAYYGETPARASVFSFFGLGPPR
jgi:hypothetical protein